MANCDYWSETAKGSVLSKDGPLITHEDSDGTVGGDVNEDMIVVALWPDGEYSIGVCKNNVTDLFVSLDMAADPSDVKKIWMWYEEESFGWCWSGKRSADYHAKYDGGSGWTTRVPEEVKLTNLEEN